MSRIEDVVEGWDRVSRVVRWLIGKEKLSG